MSSARKNIKIMSFKLKLAAHILNQGGVVSLPSDTVQGLSCLPFEASLARLIALKKRPTNKGLILLSNDIEHFKKYVESSELLNHITARENPTTYLLKAHKNTSKLLLGEFDTVAIRLTNHPLITQICAMTKGVLVSSSANISGLPTAKDLLKLRVYFHDQLDYIISPKSGVNSPSNIINLHTGERIR
jgi:L-threonylcarbamoyladenylate synthase